MPFTEDNLKRLKDALEQQGKSTDPMDRHGLTITFETSKALLARLEAAEHCVEEHGSRSCFCYKEWKKAAGK